MRRQFLLICQVIQLLKNLGYFGNRHEMVISTGLEKYTTRNHSNGRVLFHKAPAENLKTTLLYRSRTFYIMAVLHFGNTVKKLLILIDHVLRIEDTTSKIQ